MAFTVVPVCRLAELPEAALSIEGSRGLVTSSTTPIATGRSDCCQAGLSPAENPCLFTTHAKELRSAPTEPAGDCIITMYLCQYQIRPWAKIVRMGNSPAALPI